MASSISASSAAGKFGWCATALLRPPPARRTAGNLAPRRAKLSDAAIDRTAGQPSRLGGRRDTTIVPPQRFVGSEQTPATLIKMHRYVLPAHPDIVDVDHPPRIAFRARVAPSAFAILFLRSSLALDSLASRRALSHQSAWIAGGQLTSARLTRIYLDRVRRHDPVLLSFATVTEALALAQAEHADR